MSGTGTSDEKKEPAPGAKDVPQTLPVGSTEPARKPKVANSRGSRAALTVPTPVRPWMVIAVISLDVACLGGGAYLAAFAAAGWGAAAAATILLLLGSFIAVAFTHFVLGERAGRGAHEVVPMGELMKNFLTQQPGRKFNPLDKDESDD